MNHVRNLFLLLSALLVASPASSSQSFWVAGADAEGRVHVAQGKDSAKTSAEFKSTWRMDREAKPIARKLRVTNGLSHKVKILYYDPGDKVRLVAAGVISLKPGQSSNFPRTAHQIKVFKPALFDKHLKTSGVLRGHVTLRSQRGKIRFEGGTTSAPKMTFVNSTQERIKICIYDRGDVVQAIPKKIVKLDPGRTGSWQVENGTHKVKVFCPAIFDQWLADGNFPFNSTITVKQGFWAATGLTVSPGCSVGASLYLFDNSAVDGAATSASKNLYFFDDGKLMVGRQTAQAFPPFRFLQSADFGWGNEIAPGIEDPGLVGAPAAITYDVGSDLVPRFQTRLFAVSAAGELKTVNTAKWKHAAAIREWNTGASWARLESSGVTHVGAGARQNFPRKASYVVIRRDDGTLHGAYFDRGTRTTAWQALGGGTFEAGAAVAYSTSPGTQGPVRIDVFAVRTGGDLMRRSFVGDAGWGSWARQRHGCHGTPSVWHNGTQLHLAVGLIGGDVAVRKRPRSLKWAPWSTIPGSITSSPVIYTMP